MDEQKQYLNNDDAVSAAASEQTSAQQLEQAASQFNAFQQKSSDVSNDFAENASADSDFDLDPDIVQIVNEQAKPQQASADDSSNTNSEIHAFTETTQNPYERTVEPTAPIMPQISRNEYQPIEPTGTSRGMKVFAVIVAVMVLISASITGGYFLGASKFSNTKVKIDLAAKPNPEDALSISQVYDNANKSVVGIYVYNDSGIAGTASGVIYSKDGYIVTNDHIYSEVASPKFKVYTYDNKTYSAVYVAGDTRSDLAVLKIENSGELTAATFGDSEEVAVGETVVAVGRPNGATQSSTASEGIVSATARRIATTSSYNGRFIQTDSAINPGSSGGALCNLYGQVIGITSAKLVGNEYEGVGFAIPTKTMKVIVESLIEHKTVKGRAKLGISYQAVDQLTAEVTNMPCGLKIADIDEGSDLYGKSVVSGDIITHVNGTEITNSNLVLDIIEGSKPGDTLNLTIYSATGKNSFEVSVKLLEDTGSSSYTTQADNKDDSSGNQQYNSSEFSFPNGD